MQHKNYMETWGVSQSMIKTFQYKSPKQWKSIYIDKQVDLDKNEDSFTMGSLIDTLLFTPEELNDRFFIGEEVLPSKAIATIIKSYYNKLGTINSELERLAKELPIDPIPRNLDLSHSDILLDCANSYCFKDGDDEKCGWNTSWKDETRLRSLQEKGRDYFESLSKAAGRKIISHEMNLEALRLVDILRTDPEVKDFFVESADNKLIFQLEIHISYPLLGTTQELPLKGALDIVRFNHKDKTVQIIDFKSSYSAFGFVQSIKQFGYCDQLSYYDFLLRNWLVEFCKGEYCDYKMLVPLNIVIDITDRIPYVYEYDWRDIALSADGNSTFLFELHGTHDHNSRIKKGWKVALDIIGWHVINNKWDKPMELYLNKKIKVSLLNS